MKSKGVKEKKCECCGWDDMGFTHEPICPLYEQVKMPETILDDDIADWEHDNLIK